MELVGKKVRHISFGKGIIESYENGKIRIDFESGQSKYPVFQFPQSFEKYLSFEDEADDNELREELTHITALSLNDIETTSKPIDMPSTSISDKNEELMFGDVPIVIIPEKKHEKLTLKNIKKLKRPYDIFDDFAEIERILNAAALDLKDMGSPSVIPKRPLCYGDKWNRAAYALRYFYAYICEYINMFLDLLDLGLPDDEINLLSIGCGAKIDAWALQEALKIHRTERIVRYTGVDKEDWSKDGYCVATDINIKDEATYFNSLAGDFLVNNEINYDVILFPKSIGDIYYFDNTGEEFRKIKSALAEKSIEMEHFYIVASVIRYDDSSWNDLNALIELKNSVERNSFRCVGFYTNRFCDRYIVDPKNYVRYPEYPSSILPIVDKLTGYKPTFSRSREKYLICEFEKVREK